MCIRREYTDIQKSQKAEGGELLWGSVDENRDKNLAPTVTESAIFKLAADVSVDTAMRAPATAQELSYAPRVAPPCVNATWCEQVLDVPTTAMPAMLVAAVLCKPPSLPGSSF